MVHSNILKLSGSKYDCVDINDVVKQTVQKKHNIIVNKTLYFWGCLNLFLCCVLALECKTTAFQQYFSCNNDVAKYCLGGTALIFAINFILNIAQATQHRMAMHTIVMSPKQKKLLGISKNDPNFQSSSTPLQKIDSKQKKSFSPFTLSAFTPRKIAGPFSTTPPRHSPRQNTRSSPNTSANMSYHHSPSPKLTGHRQKQTTTHYFQESLNDSSAFDNFYDSPITASHGIRQRLSPFRSLAASPDECIADQKSLQSYLKNFTDSEARQNMFYTSLDSSYGSSSGFRSYGRMAMSPLETSQELLKNQYQIAVSSPKSPSSRNKDDKDEPGKYSAFEYWRKHNVGSDELVTWVARLRAWLSATLLAEVYNEIQKVNKKLHTIGCPEVQVGQSSLSTLKQVESTKCSQIPNLTKLIPYLEVTNNQEYLVQRVKEISTGGYMSEFRWCSGGNFKERKWNNELPTDSDIVIHFFCSYMDSHLPAHPRFTHGKTFTRQYFMKTPDKPNKCEKQQSEKEEKLLIYQSKTNPPHFQLITEDATYNFPPGRSNLFCTLVTFLHIIKARYSGMLGQVNLGMSGINFMWIFEEVIE